MNEYVGPLSRLGFEPIQLTLDFWRKLVFVAATVCVHAHAQWRLWWISCAPFLRARGCRAGQMSDRVCSRVKSHTSPRLTVRHRATLHRYLDCDVTGTDPFWIIYTSVKASFVDSNRLGWNAWSALKLLTVHCRLKEHQVLRGKETSKDVLFLRWTRHLKTALPKYNTTRSAWQKSLTRSFVYICWKNRRNNWIQNNDKRAYCHKC